MSNKASLTPTDYLRRLAQEAKRLSSDERSELVAGMQAHVAALEAEGLSPEEMTLRLAALGDPRRVVDDYLALTDSAKPYRTKPVVTALLSAWLVWLAVIPHLRFGFLFELGLTGAMVVFGIASAVQSIASLVLLVTTIVGGMWRRWLDGITAFGLLVGAWVMPWLVFEAQDRGAWIARTLLGSAIFALTACTVHWMLRLWHQHDRDRPMRYVLGVIAAGLALLALVLPLPSGDGSAAGAGVRVVNDTGSTVSLTFCPEQDCSGSQTRRMKDGATATFDVSSSLTPDSVVVQRSGAPTKCALMDSALPGHVPVPLYLSREADVETCGADLDSLDQ